MVDIINRIIALENQALEVVKEARQQKENIEEDIETAASKIEQEIYEQMERKITQLRVEGEQLTTAEIVRINAQTEERLRLIEQKFEQNKTKWEEEIFRKITQAVI